MKSDKPFIRFVYVAIACLSCTATLLAVSILSLGDQEELDTSFTYQGQVRDAGIPINGDGDVRLSLWNAGADGNMVAEEALFEGVNLVEGRYSVEPDFGPEAFNGAKRWIEIAFRSPSGVGEYVTLSPRQEVTATPYALYALNGRIGPEGPQGPPGDDRWVLDGKTGDIGYTDGRVGIGTVSPTAMLEVVGGPGNESVELPDSSISLREVDFSTSASRAIMVNFSSPSGGYGYDEWLIDIPETAGFLTVVATGTYVTSGAGSSCPARCYLELSGSEYQMTRRYFDAGTTGYVFHCLTVPVESGLVSLKFSGFADCENNGSPSTGVPADFVLSVSASFSQLDLNMEQQ